MKGRHDHDVMISKKWLENVSKGLCQELEARTLHGLQIDHLHKGLIICNFLIPDNLSDKDGNWHVGAIATLVDNVGAVAVASLSRIVKASVDFNLSFYSTAKVLEEVEIKAKVAGQEGKLVSVILEVKKKQSGELIALGRQWITTLDTQARSSKL